MSQQEDATLVRLVKQQPGGQAVTSLAASTTKGRAFRIPLGQHCTMLRVERLSGSMST
jgi:hypothetical protein